MKLKSPQPLRLFAIRVLATGHILPGLFFSDKQAAKRTRHELGDAAHCVTYGPDHRLFKK